MSAESGAAVGVPTPPGVPAPPGVPVPPGVPMPPGVPAVPPPPAGPGVQPPFVAPPTDGTRQRRWVAIGLATGFAVLVCVGGLLALGGLVVLGTQVVRDEAEASVTKYLTALRDEKYTQAYALLCDREQARVSEANFVNTQVDAPHVTSFTVGSAELSDQIRVPATVNYANGAMDSIHYIMEQDGETGAVEVCGQED